MRGPSFSDKHPKVLPLIALALSILFIFTLGFWFGTTVGPFPGTLDQRANAIADIMGEVHGNHCIIQLGADIGTEDEMKKAVIVFEAAADDVGGEFTASYVEKVNDEYVATTTTFICREDT